MSFDKEDLGIAGGGGSQCNFNCELDLQIHQWLRQSMEKNGEC